MSESMACVHRAPEETGLDPRIVEAEGARTAQDAAAAVCCALDQIVKSVMFQGHDGDTCRLFLTAGGHQGEATKAAARAGEPLDRADAAPCRRKPALPLVGSARWGT